MDRQYRRAAGRRTAVPFLRGRPSGPRSGRPTGPARRCPTAPVRPSAPRRPGPIAKAADPDRCIGVRRIGRWHRAHPGGRGIRPAMAGAIARHDPTVARRGIEETLLWQPRIRGHRLELDRDARAAGEPIDEAAERIARRRHGSRRPGRDVEAAAAGGRVRHRRLIERRAGVAIRRRSCRSSWIWACGRGSARVGSRCVEVVLVGLPGNARREQGG